MTDRAVARCRCLEDLPPRLPLLVTTPSRCSPSFFREGSHFPLAFVALFIYLRIYSWLNIRFVSLFRGRWESAFILLPFSGECRFLCWFEGSLSVRLLLLLGGDGFGTRSETDQLHFLEFLS